MLPVLEAVPNVSAGRDPELVERLARVVEDHGADLLDRSMDPDHNRSVFTYVGPPDVVEAASFELVRVAVEVIDLRRHQGAHPRVGAVDVLPFVPLVGVSMSEAVAVARRVATRIADELGVPAYLYGEASEPPGRPLADLRRGGFETLVSGFPPGRTPDRLPPGWSHAGVHPTAGATCVGARPLLLAWNLEVAGVDLSALRRVAATLREGGGGVEGLRTLALALPERGVLQLSMNLEDVRNRLPYKVFELIERRVRDMGGRVVGTEVIGLVPDELVVPAGADRLSLLDPDPSRVLSSRVIAHVSDRVARCTEALRDVRGRHGDRMPDAARTALDAVIRDLGPTADPG